MSESMNREEAARVLQRASERLRDGNLEGALKDVRKSIQMAPTAEAERVLAEIMARIAAGVDGNAYSNTSESSRPSRTPTPSSTSSASSAAPAPEARPFTPEQHENVKRILLTESYYEILGVSKTADEAELKRGYRKTALLYHPDKNAAPGAEEAFKLVSEAFKVLSDPASRRDYDTHGRRPARGASGTTSPSGFRSRSFHAGEFGANVTAEELFDMFFNNQFPGARFASAQTARRQQFRPHTVHTEVNISSIFPFLLVLTLLMYAFSGPSPQPQYSLRALDPFNHMRTTAVNEIPYYVAATFESTIASDPQALKSIERAVELDAIRQASAQCQREREYRDTEIKRARYYGNEATVKAKSALPTPSCDRYYQYTKQQANVRS